jgi:hypothetical protein
MIDFGLTFAISLSFLCLGLVLLNFYTAKKGKILQGLLTYEEERTQQLEEKNKVQEADSKLKDEAIDDLNEKLSQLMDKMDGFFSELNPAIVIAFKNADLLHEHMNSVLEKELYSDDPVLNNLMMHTREHRDSLEAVEKMLSPYIVTAAVVDKEEEND